MNGLPDSAVPMDTAQSPLHENGGYPAKAPSSSPEDGGLRQRLHRRLTAEIDTKWGDIILVGCFFCAGLIDSTAFNIYGCFVSMQTGNTIFAALGVSGLPDSSPTFAWAKALMAIMCFMIGAFCFANFHRLLSPRKRWVLIASFGLQCVMIITAASLVTIGVTSNKRQSVTQKDKEQNSKIDSTFPFIDLLPIGLLAFQSAGQVVASRILKYNAMPTVVLTTLYTDLMMDSHLLTAGLFEDPQRNRRAASAIMLFVGAVIGGVIAKSWLGFAGALWIGAFLKSLMVLAWLLWKPLTVQEPVAEVA
jgi:uncharacterized membrane protein YoaK (UPF0700 family)